MFDGVIPVVATPFHADGALDEAGLGRLINAQLEWDASALCCLGYASEALSLSRSERDVIVSRTRKEAGDRVPVIVGVAALGLAGGLEQATDAAESGADALMVAPPLALNWSDNQLLEFFGVIGTESTLPILLQHAPELGQVNLDSVRRLWEEGVVAGVKVETATTVESLCTLSVSAPGLPLVGGRNSLMMVDEYINGALATMPACSVTDLLVEVMALLRSGDIRGARQQHARLLPLLVYGLQPGIAWSVHKHVLRWRGLLDTSIVRVPARPLSSAMEHDLMGVLEDLGIQGGFQR